MNIIKSDRHLSAEEAQEIRARWLAAGGDLPMVVLGEGLTYRSTEPMVQVDEHQWVHAKRVIAVSEDNYSDGWMSKIRLIDGSTLMTRTRAAEVVKRLAGDLSFNANEMAFKVEDNRPHSRACGIQRHDHGSDCAPDCPTCHPDGPRWPGSGEDLR